MTRLLLPVHTGEELWGVDFGLVTVGRERAEWLLGVFEEADRLRVKYDVPFYGIEIFDYAVEYFERLWRNEAKREVEEELDNLTALDSEPRVLNAEEWALIRKHSKSVAIAVPSLVVTPTELLWHAYLKHDDRVFNTVTVSRELIDTFAKGGE